MATSRRLLIRLGRTREQIALLEDAFDKMNTGDRAGISEYETHTGTDIGKQRTRYRSLKEIRDQLDKLYAQEETILSALNSRGVVYLNLIRRSCGNYNQSI